MINKQTLKLQSLLLFVAMLLNPIFVSADALFSVNTGADIVQTENCHDMADMAAETQGDVSTQCCDGVCQCGASGCHASSVNLSSNKVSFTSSTYFFLHKQTCYLSFVASPSYPPPIA